MFTPGKRTCALVVHFCGFRIPQSLPVESFQSVAKVEVFTLNTLRVKLKLHIVQSKTRTPLRISLDTGIRKLNLTLEAVLVQLSRAITGGHDFVLGAGQQKKYLTASGKHEEEQD